MPRDDRIAVVIATRNRAASLLATLARLRALPERPRVTVVDNGSTDATAEAVRRDHPEVVLVCAGGNLGCGARNDGVRAAQARYVAFSDDDSWWAPGALGRAANLLDASPRLALLAARVLVGPEDSPDPVCDAMAASPLGTGEGLPGPRVLGFLACGSVVRREAFLRVGGFEARFGIGGEEELLALDLAAAGWELAYAADVVAHHHPTPTSDRGSRRRVQARNALWAAWLRRPAGVAWRRTARLLRPALRDPEVRAALADAARGLPWVLRRRRRIPDHLEAALRALGR